ncbi:alkaline phosphatase family protein [Photobacterium japonica]|uniref:alkaline phosphatase family protein n=1 Tax=Photobacterium japonica TaxID=2910235 RepID=UPI003D0C2BF5
MPRFTMNTMTVGILLALSPLSALVPLSAKAEISRTPIMGGLVNSAEVLQHHIVSSVSYSTRLTRDMTVFTIGGLTLDAYLITLPLDAKTKARVMGQLADPTYAIPLGYFLYQFYDRYTGIGNEDVFKAYLKTVYDERALTGFEHSLFTLNAKTNTENKDHKKDQAHQEGIKVDGEFMAAMVTVYDALVQIGEWQDMAQLPSQYTYLTNSAHDLALVSQIQPIVIHLLMQASAGMEDGDMKNALLTIIDDGAPEQQSNNNNSNNKAQALTITLIDFIRLNVLKAYRQFVYQDERAIALNNWLQNAFNDQPSAAIGFLQSQQQRRFAVQITVDGLQQGLMEGLVDPKKPFIGVAYNNHLDHKKYDAPETVSSPDHEQDTRFLQTLAEQPYNDPHYLPFFTRLYQAHTASIARVGISSTPTISVRNLPIIKTGAKVSGEQGTGIPNFHFVDREEDRAYYFFGNDALQLDRLMQANNVKTMFDRLNYLKTLNCNAQYDWNAHTSYDALVNLGAGETLRDFGEKRCVRELQERAKTEQQLTRLREQLIHDITAYQYIPSWRFYTKLSHQWKVEQAIETYAQLDGKGMPDYTLIYNPWPDHFAHFVGPFSDELIMPTGELNRLDYWIGQVEQTYRDAGVYPRTLWGMAGDHGLAPVYYTLNPEKAIFAPLEKRLGYPLSIRKISSDEGEGPKITNALNSPTNKGIDVVVASTAGGNFMLDVFNATQGWKTQPRYHELTQWQPINSTSNASTSLNNNVDLIAETLTALGDTLDYLVVRENACTEQTCHVRLVGQRNGKRVDEFIQQQDGRYFYSAKDHNSSLLNIHQMNPYLPLKSKADVDTFAHYYNLCVTSAEQTNPHTWCDANQWRALTRFTPRPDSVIQLATLYAEPRAGTINLFPRDGIGYNTRVPGRHAGESYLEKDAFIGFWGEPIGPHPTPLISEENGSLAPTLFEYLTGETVVVNQNGWGYPSLLNKLDVDLESTEKSRAN